MASRRHARRGPFADGPTGIPDPIAGPDGRRRRGPPAAPLGQHVRPLPGRRTATAPSGAFRARGHHARTSERPSTATLPERAEQYLLPPAMRKPPRWAAFVQEEPAATYSPRRLPTKYHRR